MVSGWIACISVTTEWDQFGPPSAQPGSSTRSTPHVQHVAIGATTSAQSRRCTCVATMTRERGPSPPHDCKSSRKTHSEPREKCTRQRNHSIISHLSNTERVRFMQTQASLERPCLCVKVSDVRQVVCEERKVLVRTFLRRPLFISGSEKERKIV